MNAPIKPLTCRAARAAEILGVSETTIWRLIKAGDLTAVRVGRNTLIRYSDLEALVSPAQKAAQ